MDLDSVPTNLAKTPERLHSLLSDCRKRNRIQPANPEMVQTLLAKAQYNLQVAEIMDSEGFSDWVIVSSYSAMFLAANAFTARFANETAKDHACILGLLVQTLRGQKLSKELTKIKKAVEKEAASMEKIRRVRNSALYTVTDVNEKTTQNCLKTASQFVEQIEKLVEYKNVSEKKNP